LTHHASETIHTRACPKRYKYLSIALTYTARDFYSAHPNVSAWLRKKAWV